MNRSGRAAVVFALGAALLAAVGPILVWVEVTVTSGPAAVGGVAVPRTEEVLQVNGLLHWTGDAAFVAAFACAGMIAGVLRWPRRRETGLVLASVFGIATCAATVFAMVRPGSVAQSVEPTFFDRISQVERFGASVGVLVRVESSAGPGAYQAAVGGGVAAFAAGVALAVSRRRAQVEGPPP